MTQNKTLNSDLGIRADGSLARMLGSARLLLLALMIVAGTASAQNRGVPQSGFPSWGERMVLVYTNRARADPQADLAGCAPTICGEKACYQNALPPLAQSYNLNRAARFHAGNLEYLNQFAHDSPCTLVSGISSLYPPNGTCNGESTCACAGGGSTTWSARIAAFGTSPTSENIAYGYSSPRQIFYLWFWEEDPITACGFRAANGHRYNILGTHGQLGVGYYRVTRHMWVQDFGGGSAPSGTLIAGGHEPLFSGGATEFRVNYYDTRGAPQQAQVNIDGTCTPMTLERGSATNATYLATTTLSGTTCRRYVFEFKDPAGQWVKLPETGSYGVGDSTCADWIATAPGQCGTTNLTPTVANPASAMLTSGTSAAVSALGADDGGELALKYSWSATGPGSVTFSPNGTNVAKSATATFSAAGSYTLTVTIADTSNLSVTSSTSITVNAIATNLQVSPASASVANGGTQQFTASTTDQFGAPMSPQPAVTWSVSGGGTISATGAFTAGPTPGGPHTVTAQASSKSATAQVTVTSGTGPMITALASASPNPVSATTAACSVSATDDGGESALKYTWTASGPAAVTFSPNATNAAKNTTATFAKAGTYVLTVNATDVGNQNGISTVQVIVNATPTTLQISPAVASIPSSSTQQFVSTVRDQFGDALGTQPQATWSVSGGGTIDANGLFTAGQFAGGPHTVSVQAANKTATAQVTVTGSTAPLITTAASANPNPVSAKTTAVSALANDDTGEAGLSYTWSAVGPEGVTFAPNGSNAAKNSTATFSRAGTYSLTVTATDATNQSATSTVQVTVTPSLTRLAVSPSATSVVIGQTQLFTAQAVDQFDHGMSTGTVSWATNGGGTISSAGLFTAGQTPGGPFTITATAGAATGTAQATVIDAPDTMPPQAAISEPVAGASLFGSVVISATASDDVGVARVEFFVDGVLLSESTSAPFVAVWQTGAPGPHVLQGRAFDLSGNQADSAPVAITVQDTSAPAVAILSPDSGPLESDSVEVTVQATDDVGVASVELQLDGAPVAALTREPWRFTVNVESGAHALVAVAKDAAGNEGRSSEVVIERGGLSPVTGQVGCTAAGGWSGAAFVIAALSLLLARLRHPR